MINAKSGYWRLRRRHFALISVGVIDGVSSISTVDFSNANTAWLKLFQSVSVMVPFRFSPLI